MKRIAVAALWAALVVAAAAPLHGDVCSPVRLNEQSAVQVTSVTVDGQTVAADAAVVSRLSGELCLTGDDFNYLPGVILGSCATGQTVTAHAFFAP